MQNSVVIAQVGCGGDMISGISTAMPDLASSLQPSTTYGSAGASTETSSSSSMSILSSANQLRAGGAVAVALANAAVQEREVARLTEAADLLSAGEYAEAREVAMAFQKEYPTSASAAHIIGRAYMGEGNYEAAEEHLERAAALSSDDESIQNDLFNARVLQKPDEAVVKVANSLLKSAQTATNGLRLYFLLSDRSPKNADISLKLADALDNAGGTVAAVGAFEDALINGSGQTLVDLEARLKEFVSDNSYAGVGFALLGRTQLKLGKIDDAIASFERALEAAPEHEVYTEYLADAYAEKGSRRLEKGDATGALRDLEYAESLLGTSTMYDEKEAQAHLALGEKMTSRGATRQAFDELVAARNLTDDTQTEEDLAQAFFTLGRRYQQAGNLEYAQLTFKYACQLDDSRYSYKFQCAETSDELGLQQQADGYIAGAVRSFQTAVDLFPDTAKYQDHLEAAKALLE